MNQDQLLPNDANLLMIVNAITKLVAVEAIYCFGITGMNIEKECSGTEKDICYYLFLITGITERRSDDVVIDVIKSEISIEIDVFLIVNNIESINKALVKGSSFLNLVFSKGIKIYHKENKNQE